jgi:N utilization substance protein B
VRLPRLPTVQPVARREARERALSLLYEAESKGVEPVALLDELPVPPDAFAAGLVSGVGLELGRIDSLISSHSIGWVMDRMPAVDRALLRMATFELLSHPDVPTAVVISEAVDLAAQYSTDESGRFVNGVLAAIAVVVRGDEGGGGAGDGTPNGELP